MDGTVSTDIVASKSVPGQAAESETAVSTTSAVNSAFDQTVTEASENTGTVSGSVHIRRENVDMTTETVFTSMTAVPTAVSPVITTSSVTPTEDCGEAMLCEMGAGYFVINPTACATNDSLTIDTSIATTVEILTNGNSVSRDLLCHWNMEVPKMSFINVTIDQLVLEKDESGGAQTLELYV